MAAKKSHGNLPLTEWNDESSVYVFSETVATDGVVGMLGGITIDPSVGNAVENDAGITEFDLYNSAGALQNIDQAYSNQEIRMVGKIRLQDIDIAPDPTAYFLVVEEKDWKQTERTPTLHGLR